MISRDATVSPEEAFREPAVDSMQERARGLTLSCRALAQSRELVARIHPLAAFEYLALDGKGQNTRGVIEADTARSARALLRERGLNALEVHELNDKAKPGSGADFSLQRNRLGSKQLVVLTEQLSTLIHAGLPIDEALSALSDETDDARLKRVVAALRARVLEGRTLADAFREFPDSFPELFPATTAAGEQTGKLGDALGRLAEYTQNRDSLQRDLIAALAYPLLLLTVALGVVTGLMTSVVPKIVAVFDNVKADLPWLTKVLIQISNLLVHQGIWLLLGLVACIVAAVLLFRQESVRTRLDTLLLRLPLIGRLLRAADTARAARTLAVLIGSGVPVLDALKLAVPTLRRLPLREGLRKAATRVREGASLGRALTEARVFPAVTLRLVASGEKSGRLSEMLDASADHLARDVRQAMAVTNAILSPILILFVGAIVLAIVLAILLPIFELNTLISQ